MGLTHPVYAIAIVGGLFIASTTHAGPKDFERNMDVAPPTFIGGGGQNKAPKESRSTAATPAPAEHTEQAVDQSQLHWNYDNPAEWGELDAKYKLCKDGKRQSPIDISDTTYANLDSISFNYRSGPKEIINNGHTIQVNMHSGSYITVSGKRYNLLQFHFHAPSEHTINGKPADMVAHFVHQASDGQLGVVAVLMERCKQNDLVEQLWKKLPKRNGDKNNLSKRINVKDLIPDNRDYYNYSGSLTTPPCSEGVNWMVLKRPMEISADQIKAFTDLFPKSVRPIQEKFHRPVRSKN